MTVKLEPSTVESLRNELIKKDARIKVLEDALRPLALQAKVFIPMPSNYPVMGTLLMGDIYHAKSVLGED